MSLGYEVNKNVLNMKAAQAAKSLKTALEQAEVIAAWLTDNPNPGEDPLVTNFGYTTDEAYTLRYYFEQIDAMRVANSNILNVGRKFTGLE